MNELFLTIVNMSISASWIILAVVVLRFILKRMPKWISVLFWGIAAVRLILPFSFESAWSLLPSAKTIPLDIEMNTAPAINSGIKAVDQVVNPIISGINTPQNGDSVNPLQVTIAVLALLWAFGAAVFYGYILFSYCRLHRSMHTAVLYQENIFQSEKVKSPFVLGIFKPKIYLPFAIDEQEAAYILAHEKAHISRKDHLWKLIGCILLGIYWFNPLVWLGFILFCRDMELACDEKVIKELDQGQKADYAQALLSFSLNSPVGLLAFGEVGVKERIKAVLKYKKTAVWFVGISIVICALIAACFLTDPVAKNEDVLRLKDRDTPNGGHFVLYEVNLGNQAMSGTLYAEQWIKGECVRSSPVVLTQDVEEIQIGVRARSENNAVVGMDLQIETDEYGGSLLTYFDFSQAFSGEYNTIGWGFTSFELNEEINFTAGEDLILASIVFDMGNGARVFPVERLNEEPKYLHEAEHMIVVRASFSSEELGVQKAEETGLPMEIS